jgi:hypothetical protein
MPLRRPLAIPLILRRVPRNAFYGFRTCATVADDFVWYEANAYFGRRLVAFSLASAAAVPMLYSTDGVSQRLFFGSTVAARLLPSFPRRDAGDVPLHTFAHARGFHLRAHGDHSPVVAALSHRGRRPSVPARPSLPTPTCFPESRATH